MLHIYCPYCEEMREEEEFAYSGEAHIARPTDPESLTDAQWGDYVFFPYQPTWFASRNVEPCCGLPSLFQRYSQHANIRNS